MILKIFGARKLAPTPTPVAEEGSSAVLKIIHAGGLVELYYMAVPAARIIDKYPSFMLTRPDVFQRPWGAIICREEILIPGQKYFLVPPRTLKKLIRRIKKPSCQKESFSSSSSFVQNRFDILIKSKSKKKSGDLRVRFFGIDAKQDSDSVSSEHNNSHADNNSKKGSHLQPAEVKKRRVRPVVQWQPSLISINE
ncbi:unnamed protein product [Coffea canephora]|uniref:Uncharacterized protein n=1 Tax=Coffea canephora TaxID=49390 RepID=A0A068V1G7_COFCA|nr:unnamed protein product [Coffea canephora]